MPFISQKVIGITKIVVWLVVFRDFNNDVTFWYQNSFNSIRNQSFEANDENNIQMYGN